MDGSLSGHCAAGADVFGAGIHRCHSGSLPPTWRRNESLRSGSLCRHVQSCPCAAVAENPTIQASQSLKGATAREANRVLGRTGETFWQAESYDHWVRDEKEWQRIEAYIENNPVKAGLVSRAEDYRWSSAGKSAETSLGAADTSVCATFTGS